MHQPWALLSAQSPQPLTEVDRAERRLRHQVALRLCHPRCPKSINTRREYCSVVTDVAVADTWAPCFISLFAFESTQPGEMALVKDELVEVAQKDDGGELSGPSIYAHILRCTALQDGGLSRRRVQKDGRRAM